MRNIDLELLHKSVNEIIDRTLEEKRILGTVVHIALGGKPRLQQACWLGRPGAETADAGKCIV